LNRKNKTLIAVGVRGRRPISSEHTKDCGAHYRVGRRVNESDAYGLTRTDVVHSISPWNSSLHSHVSNVGDSVMSAPVPKTVYTRAVPHGMVVFVVFFPPCSPVVIMI